MQDTDRKAFYQTWATAWELCGKSVTDRMLQFAFECLRQYGLSDIQRGVIAHAKDCEAGQFPPKPADIIRQLEGSAEDRALAWWSVVEQGICGRFMAKHVVFDDPTVHMVVDEMGGFAAMGRRNQNEVPFMQKDFVKRYAMRLKFPSEYPAKLPTSATHSRDDVLFIGNEEKARRLLDSAECKRLTAA